MSRTIIPNDSRPRPSAPKLPPRLEGGLPIVGHGLEFNKNPVRLLNRARELYGDLCTLSLPGADAILMSGTKAQEKFFRLSDEDISQAEAYQMMTPIFGKKIAYDAPQPIMKEQLGFFHEALREARMRTYANGFIEEANEYFEGWDDFGMVDMYDVGNELTIYTSSRSLLGKPFRDKLSGEFAELYHDMEDGLSVLAFLAPNLPTPAFRRRDRARERMVELITKIVDDRKSSGYVGDDMLQSLMDASYKDGRKLSEQEITGLLLTIMFAGHHTSGVTFSWTGVLLAQHPEWVAELRAEQEHVLGGRDELTLEDLRAMPKLEATVKEVLRMYPPIILMMRKVVNDFEFGGYDFPRGTMIFGAPAVSHYIEEIFPNPTKFDPTRFLDPNNVDKKHPMGWIPFGAGRHRCMGIVFAQLQLRALWSHLLRNFDFEIVRGDIYEPDYSRLLVGPRQPCRLSYRRRRKSTIVAA
ncbi:cytochrome P450 [Pseudenhygromyxa sp. WMMC2535]|uniref:cytochrome P450 n=1 Tax=Pseudenhygromyxa sp. WMMC2535 TaxID=2712867 RepID=UPI001552EE92|nr:cytochrome P450 [Pseudenhygromyxa sp. WMMC2535]NVB37308.1 cytochrome P450 [Pseudenhygromyxa sp. WMMC2535]